MAQTKAALIQEVIGELHALGSGQSASADEIAFIETRIAGIVAELHNNRVITIDNIEAIPDYAFPDLIRMVAEDCAPKLLHRPIDDARRDAARASLIRLTRLDRSASPFVLAVLEQLDAFGASSPTLDATAVAGRIPAFIAELAARNVIYVADMDEIESSGGDKHPGFNDFAKYVAANLASPPLYPVIQFAEGRLRQLAPAGTYPTLAVDYF